MVASLRPTTSRRKLTIARPGCPAAMKPVTRSIHVAGTVGGPGGS
jgi:hypothetical protein